MLIRQIVNFWRIWFLMNCQKIINGIFIIHTFKKVWKKLYIEKWSFLFILLSYISQWFFKSFIIIISQIKIMKKSLNVKIYHTVALCWHHYLTPYLLKLLAERLRMTCKIFVAILKFMQSVMYMLLHTAFYGSQTFCIEMSS